MPPKEAFSTDIETSIFPDLIDIFKTFSSPEERAGTLLIMQQHGVLTLAWMLDMAQRLGFDPNHIYFLGKHYSDSQAGSKYIQNYCREVHLCTGQSQFEIDDDIGAISKRDVRGMLDQVAQYVSDNTNVIKNVLLLDDGGDVILETLAGIENGRYAVFTAKGRKFATAEMTTRGTRKVLRRYQQNMPIPYIACSSSMIKKMGSGHFPEASWRVLQPLLKQMQKPNVAIIGIGNIGNGLEQLLRSHGVGITPFYYDNSALACERIPQERLGEVEKLLKTADILFGATGENWTRNDVDAIIGILSTRQKPITFVSMSSERVEFDALLQELAKRFPDSFKYDGDNPLADIKVTVASCEVAFFHGGFPANFSSVKELDGMQSLYPEDAQIYQAELGIAIMIMGLAVAAKYNERQGAANFLVINPILEQLIARLTLEKNPTLFRYCCRRDIARFNSLSAIVRHSDYAHDNLTGTVAATGVEYGCDVFVAAWDEVYGRIFSRSALVGITEDGQEYNWMWIAVANMQCRVYALGSGNSLCEREITLNEQPNLVITAYNLPGQNELLAFYRDKIYQETVFTHLKRKLPPTYKDNFACVSSLIQVQRYAVILELLWRQQNDKLVREYHHLWRDRAINVAKVASVERLWWLRLFANVYKAANIVGVPAGVVQNEISSSPLLASTRSLFAEILEIFSQYEKCIPAGESSIRCQNYYPTSSHYIVGTIIKAMLQVTLSNANKWFVKYDLTRVWQLYRQTAAQISRRTVLDIGNCDRYCQDRLSELRVTLDNCLSAIEQYLHIFYIATNSTSDPRCRILRAVIGEVEIIEDKLRQDSVLGYQRRNITATKEMIYTRPESVQSRVNLTASFIPFCRDDFSNEECAVQAVSLWQQRDILARESAKETVLCEQAAGLFQLPESRLFSELVINPMQTVSQRAFMAGFLAQSTRNLLSRSKLQDEVCHLLTFLVQISLTLFMLFPNPLTGMLVMFGVELLAGLLQLIPRCPQQVANLLSASLLIGGNTALVWQESGKGQALLEAGRQTGLLFFGFLASKAGIVAANKLLPPEASLLDLTDAKRIVPTAERGFFARMRSSLEHAPGLVATSLGFK